MLSVYFSERFGWKSKNIFCKKQNKNKKNALSSNLNIDNYTYKIKKKYKKNPHTRKNNI